MHWRDLCSDVYVTMCVTHTQADLKKEIASTFEFTKLRDSLNKAGVAFDEDSQRGVDRISRLILQVSPALSDMHTTYAITKISFPTQFALRLVSRVVEDELKCSRWPASPSCALGIGPQSLQSQVQIKSIQRLACL